MESGSDFRTRDTIEKALADTTNYHEWLMEEQSHTVAAVEGQVKGMDEFLKRRAAAEEILSMPNLSQEAGIIWENKIQIINEQQKQ